MFRWSCLTSESNLRARLTKATCGARSCEGVTTVTSFCQCVRPEAQAHAFSNDCVNDFLLGPLIKVVHQLSALVSEESCVLKLDWSFHTDNGSAPTPCAKERQVSQLPFRGKHQRKDGFEGNLVPLRKVNMPWVHLCNGTPDDLAVKPIRNRHRV